MFIFCFSISFELQVQSFQQKVLFRSTFQRDSQLKNINMFRLRFQCQRIECKFYDQHINIHQKDHLSSMHEVHQSVESNQYNHE